MPKAELVFGNVLDGRVYEANGVEGPSFVYGFSAPGRALPFAVVRHWKAPQGVVVEGFEIISPNGTTAYHSPTTTRRMPGQMDLTEIVDVVEDAVLPELGVYVVSFLIDGEVEGQVEFQYVLQEAPDKLPKELEDGFRKTDVIWVGVDRDGRDETIPAWFAYQQGRVYLLHAIKDDSPEQRVPGADDATDLLVITRHKYRDTRLSRLHATARVIEPSDGDFARYAGILADRRRDRHGPPEEAIASWRQGHVILELIPLVPG
ncbi:MAG TPA: hypothetical protein VF097_07785 [Actinomycetota bacterium]